MRAWLPKSALAAVLCCSVGIAADEADLKPILAKPILSPGQTLAELQTFLEARLPAMPQAKSAKEWEGITAKLRERVLAEVVFRGEAAAWRDAKSGVVWSDAVPGGPGYRLKKV